MGLGSAWEQTEVNLVAMIKLINNLMVMPSYFSDLYI